MAAHDKLSVGVIESISKILGETEFGLKGREIDEYLVHAQIENINPSATKWKRLYEALTAAQMRDATSNRVFKFIEIAMSPARNIENGTWFEETREELNEVLSFEGISLDEDGRLKKATKVSTISEAKKRSNNFKNKLIQRGVHPSILAYCNDELVAENYFHSVFEATKSIADEIRKKTGLLTDGSRLVDDAFTFRSSLPHLAINSLTTESDKSEHTGFMNLLKGIFGMFRNTSAHDPKIYFSINEADALDIMTVISLAHKKIELASTPLKLMQGVD